MVLMVVLSILTLYNKYVLLNKGFTLLEILIVVSLIISLTSIIVFKINPVKYNQKSRDTLRMSNIAEIERAINEYFLDTGKYPGEVNTLYVSSTPNWIPIPNMNKYISKIPMDPGNNFYYYTQNGHTYEVNSSLEFFVDLMQKDGGNNDNSYEVGTNLLLLNTN